MPHFPALKRVVDFHDSVYCADKFIKTASYALCLIGNVIDLSIGPRQSNHPETAAHVLSEAFQKFGGEMSMARYVNRICGGSTGILQELENIVHLSWLSGWRNQRIKTCVRVSSMTMVAYYAYEILSWVGWKAPKLIKGMDADSMMRKSCFFFTLWGFIEMYATSCRIQEVCTAVEKLREIWGGNNSPTQVKKLADAEEAAAKSIYILRLTYVRHLIFITQGVSWTVKPSSPFSLPAPLINSLGLVEAVLGYWMAWKGMSTARPYLGD